MSQIDRARRAIIRAVSQSDQLSYETASMGKLVNSTPVYEVRGKPDWVWVTKDNGTITSALNRGAVPLQWGLQVKMRLEPVGYVIHGWDRVRQAPGTVPSSPYGVPPHPTDWATLENVPETFPPEPHAASHLMDGDDALTTTEPTPDGVPQAYGDGYINLGWVDPAHFSQAVGSSIDGATVSSSMTTTDRIAAVIGGVLRFFTYQTIRDAIKGYYDSVVATLTNKSIDASANTITNINTSAMANDAISNAKLANMANATVKGRTTSGAGDPEDLTMAQLVALIEAQALYFLLAGRSGGQTAYGATGSGGNLTLSSTPHGTKGKIFFGANAAYDEVNNRLGLGITSPTFQFEAWGADALGHFRRINGVAPSRAPAFVMARARGTPGAEADIVANDQLGKLQFRGRVGGADQEYGAVSFVATDTSQNGRYAFLANDLNTEVAAIYNNNGRMALGPGLTPQGQFHAHDGVGGWLEVSKTGVAGTKVVIIPDGTGDVLAVLTGLYSLQNSDGTVTGGMFVIAKGGSHAATIGGTTWAFAVSAGGEFSVIRTAGSDTATIVMTLNWR